MFDITIIESGSFMADGGAIFGAIPKRAWARKYTEIGDNKCKMAMRCVLATSQDRKILIDLGMGNKHLDKVAYYQPHELKDIADELLKYNIVVNEITDVILSHLHFDHCGYATTLMQEGEILPTFCNAKYWLSKAQWDNMQDMNRLEKDSVFADNIIPVNDAKQLHLIEEDMWLCDGFQLRIYHGHSVGQLVPYIATKTGVVTVPGDLIPTAAHVPLEWISAYDLCAQTTLKEKERFLAEAEREGHTLVYYHDAYTASSKVEKINDNYCASK